MSHMLRLGAAALITLSAAFASAQTSSEAAQLMQKATSYTQTLKSYYMEMNSTMTMQSQTVPMKIQIWAEPPTKMVVLQTSAMGSSRTYMAGDEMISYIPTMNKYTKTKVPKEAQAQMAGAMFNPAMAGAGAGAGALDKLKGEIVGKETRNGVPCVHIKLNPDPSVAMHMWIKDGKDPLPVAMKMEMTGKMPMNMDGDMQWIVNEPIPAETFKFTPPPGATEMNMSNMMGGPGAGAPGAGAPGTAPAGAPGKVPAGAQRTAQPAKSR